MTDLAGGMDPSVDEVTATPPEHPTFREGAALFLWDDEGRFGIPRVGVEAVGSTWTSERGFQLTIQQPDGRMLAINASGAPHAVDDGDGRPRVLGAGPLRFACVEPFQRWQVDFEGDLVETTVDVVRRDGPPTGARAGGDVTGAAIVPVHLSVDARMAAPPWVLGTREPAGAFPPVGEHRFEQLLRATGSLRIGDDEGPFTGGGLRIHRKGGNRGAAGDFFGHCWQTGLFPSGRAFGFLHYHPRPDGSVKYHEGWVRDGGRTLPAKVVETPWQSGWRDRGEDVSFTLRTAEGDVHIEAETFVSWFKPPTRPGGFPTWQAGITTCRWDGEAGHGMIERTPITA